MDTGYSEQQEAFRQSLRRCLEDRGGTAFTRARWEATPALEKTDWRELAELGVTGLLVPADSAGVGGDMTDAGVVMEEMGRAVQPGPVWASCIGGTSAAAAFDQRELLARLAAGDAIATLALAEPAHRFTRWADASVAVEGDRLTGVKCEVPDGIGADVFFVTTAAGAYLVDACAPGLRLEAEPGFDGSRRFTTLHLDGTPGTRLGENALLAPAVDRMLVALCADAIGAASRALELTVAHATERRQFGQPIGAFQAVQHLCAQMLQRVELGRAGLHYALWAQDAQPAPEAHRAAVMCKAYAAEVLPQIGADAIQIFGGAGFTWEYDIQLYYKRLLSQQTTWGGAGEWLEELARLVIDGEAPALVAG